MKKPEIVARVDISKMAEEFDLSEESIKLALVGPQPKVEMISIKRITTAKQAIKLYWQAKSLPRKKIIALKAIELCQDIDDIEDVIGIARDEGDPEIAGPFSMKYRKIAMNLIEGAQTFKEVHDVWVRMNNEFVGVEDGLAYQKMCELARSVDPFEVIKIFESDDATYLWVNGSPQFKIIMIACESATAEQAKQTLRHYGEGEFWGSEYDSEPIRVLIRKATTLYSKN